MVDGTYSSVAQGVLLALYDGIRKRAHATTAADQLKDLAESMHALHSANANGDAVRNARRHAAEAIAQSIGKRAAATTAVDQLKFLTSAYALIGESLE